MRVRILIYVFLAAVIVDAAIYLRPPTIWNAGPEPRLIIHDRPEIALDDEQPSFGIGIRAALVAKNYADLEAMAADLRDPDRRFRGGTSQIRRFYAVLTTYNTVADDKACSGYSVEPVSFDATRSALEAWREAVPDQPTASVALAVLWGEAATAARGCGAAASVAEEKWARMEADFDQTATYLEDVPLDRDPMADSQRMEMARYLGAPRDEQARLYRLAIKAFPTYYSLYASRAEALQSMWGGEPGELADFLNDLRRPERGAEGQIAYAFAAYAVKDGYLRTRWGDAEALSFPAIVAAYQVREQRFGLRPHDWQVLFYFSLRAGMCVQAHQALPLMGRDWDSSVYYRAEDFHNDIAYFAANSPFPDDRVIGQVPPAAEK